MDARILRGMRDGWELVVAGSLSLASAVALISLLVLLARAQTPAALRPASETVTVSGPGAERVCAALPSPAPWLATVTRTTPCRLGECTKALAGAASSGAVASLLHYGAVPASAAESRVSVQPRNAATPLVFVGVVLVWLLALRVVLGPLRRVHQVQHHRRLHYSASPSHWKGGTTGS